MLRIFQLVPPITMPKPGVHVRRGNPCWPLVQESTCVHVCVHVCVLLLSPGAQFDWSVFNMIWLCHSGKKIVGTDFMKRGLKKGRVE